MEELKQEIIDVCKKLGEKGLLVRTWGNVSCRVDKNTFLITPSGIKYEDLTTNNIIEVKIKDLSYKGDILPSSEKAVHAACYRVRPECNFIIHTHQVYATVAGTLGLKKIKTFDENDSRVVIPVASYALPGTDKLAENVARRVRKYPENKGFIMANHGTVCLGADSEEALQVALDLEVMCSNFLIDNCKTDMRHCIQKGFCSHLENGEIVYDHNDTPLGIRRIHEYIYSKRPDVNYIIHNKSEAIMTVSRRANHLRPLLDDFAQLVGFSVKIPSRDDGHERGSVHVKKNCNAVFAFNDGAFCLGATEEDASAVALILDKGCIAHTAVMRFGEGHYLSVLDCIRMNRHYKKSYSKLADNK